MGDRFLYAATPLVAQSATTGPYKSSNTSAPPRQQQAAGAGVMYAHQVGNVPFSPLTAATTPVPQLQAVAYEPPASPRSATMNPSYGPSSTPQYAKPIPVPAGPYQYNSTNSGGSSPSNFHHVAPFSTSPGRASGGPVAPHFASPAPQAQHQAQHQASWQPSPAVVPQAAGPLAAGPYHHPATAALPATFPYATTPPSAFPSVRPLAAALPAADHHVAPQTNRPVSPVPRPQPAAIPPPMANVAHHHVHIDRPVSPVPQQPAFNPAFNVVPIPTASQAGFPSLPRAPKGYTASAPPLTPETTKIIGIVALAPAPPTAGHKSDAQLRIERAEAQMAQIMETAKAQQAAKSAAAVVVPQAQPVPQPHQPQQAQVPIQPRPAPAQQPQQRHDSARALDIDRRLKAQSLVGLDVVFLVDCTAAMKPLWGRVMHKIGEIIEAGHAVLPHLPKDGSGQFNFAFVGFRDHGDGSKQREIVHDFVPYKQAAKLYKDKIAKIVPEGGGDRAADVAGGLANCGSNRLTYRSRNKVILFFGNSPPHGILYHDMAIRDDHMTGDPGDLNPDTLLAYLCLEGAHFHMVELDKSTMSIMAERFLVAYNRNDNGAGSGRFYKYNLEHPAVTFLPGIYVDPDEDISHEHVVLDNYAKMKEELSSEGIYLD